MSSENSARLILGIDLGVKSVGLALLDVQQQKIIHTACRVFPAGVDGDFEGGKDESRAANRREKRLQRRQTDRRRRRQRNVYKILQQNNLLPCGPVHETLKELDQKLAKTYGPHPGAPYVLRAIAVNDRLEPYELGRALYHLGQRRGFLSNRRSPVKKDEDAGKVKTEINTLAGSIQTTLGAYLATVDPHQKRIRERYTSRKMYLDEFEAIWQAQEKHHPDALTPELKSELHEAIFHQRPLKDQSHLIGYCSLVTSEKRAPLADLHVQYFRLVERVNNLRLVNPERKLTPEERSKLIAELNEHESKTFPQIRRLLDLPSTAKFSIEEGGEKKVLGNSTNARFLEALGIHWKQLSSEQQKAVVDDWLSCPDDASFRTKLLEYERFSAEEIGKLCDVRLVDGYSGFSLSAVEQLLSKVEEGLTTTEAREIVFKDSLQPTQPLDAVPPVFEVLSEIRNPAVIRPLTELRKTINELIRKFGKPDKIHIELARDLKRSKKDRQELTKFMRENEKKREKACEELRGHGLSHPRAYDIEKYLLWQECAEICPYSGQSISFDALFGSHPLFDIEHIVPASRSFDNSFDNKTLCLREYNARKRNKTPWEAFGRNPDEWEPMVERIKKFGNRSKLRRFLLQETDTAELLEKFTTNQLNDTRYASRLAAKYLGTLYGGVNDGDGTRRIIPCAGGVTAQLRKIWKLDGILSPIDYRKSREDHRHHTVDAATVALASPRLIQLLSNETIRAELAGQRRLKSFADPWNGGFKDQLHEAIHQRTVVSHRQERKLQGAFHKETLYGRPREDKEGKCWVHVRKPVDKLAAKDYENIVDSTVRKRLLDGYKTLESGVPIKKVRIRESTPTVVIGSGFKARNVATENNHHMAVFEKQEGKKKVYTGEVISLLKAMDRFRNKLPVVNKNGGPDSEFLFSLSKGDMVMWKEKLWKVKSVWMAGNTGRLELGLSVDARLKKEISNEDLPSPRINQFCSTGGRKVTVSSLGEIRDAHD